MAWPAPVAAAAIATGELTLEPFAGLQMTTPAAVGGVQLGGGGGGGALPTVNVDEVLCRVPVLSHALTISLCVPLAAVAEPDSAPVVEAATCILSRYAFIEVMECPEPVAAAEMLIGDVTVEPFAGEQITTPAVEGAVQAAEAEFADKKSSAERLSSIPRRRLDPTIVTTTPTAETQGEVLAEMPAALAKDVKDKASSGFYNTRPRTTTLGTYAAERAADGM
jgi:hypothetical protein